MNFATRLNKALTSSCLEPREAAEQIGCTYRQLRRYLDGTSTPSIEYLKMIAKVLHVSTDELLGLTQRTDYEVVRLINAFDRVSDDKRWAVISFTEWISKEAKI